MESNNILNASIIHLIMEERFFAELIMNMKRHIDPKLPAAAGVNVTDGINLYINPYMWQSMTVVEQAEVLKHECYHVINNHFARWKELYPDGFDEQKNKSIIDRIKNNMEFKIGNLAGDFASNEYLPNLPKEMKIFDEHGNPVLEPDEIEDDKGNKTKNPNAGKQVIGRPVFVDDWRKNDPTVDKYQHMEYYWERLKQEQQKNGSVEIIMVDGEGNPMTVDDHSLWDKGAKDPEYITEKVKQAVNKAAESAKGAGSNIPPQVEKLIQALNHKAKDWKNDIKRFVAKAFQSDRESTRKKRNRRYGIIFPGWKTTEQLHLVWITDTSGSMYSELLCQGWAEMAKLHSMGVKITCIEADDQVHCIKEFNPKELPACDGRGGTSFKDALEQADELGADGLIYFTDGDATDCSTVSKPKTPLLWALPTDCKNRTSFGSETVITINKKVS